MLYHPTFVDWNRAGRCESGDGSKEAHGYI